MYQKLHFVKALIYGHTFTYNHYILLPTTYSLFWGIIKNPIEGCFYATDSGVELLIPQILFTLLLTLYYE